MPIVAECDLCGKKYRFPDHLAGTSLPCKQCGGLIDLPGGRAPRRSAKQGSSGGGVKPVPIIIGTAAAVIAAVVGFMLTRGKDEPAPVAPPNIAQNDTAVRPPQFPTNERPAVPNLQEQSRPITDDSGYSESLPPIEYEPTTNTPPATTPKTSPFQKVPAGDPPPQNTANNSAPGPSPFQKVPADAAPTEIPFQRVPSENPPLAGWTARPDPIPEELQIDPETKLKLSLKLPRQRTSNVIYPATVSPIVLLGGNAEANDESDIYDLRTGTRLARLKGISLEWRSPVAISPDGKYLASTMGRGFNQSIRIWDVKFGQVLWDLGTNEARHVAFLNPNRVLEIRSDSAAVWDVKTGKLIREIDKLRFSHQLESDCLSPNGRYLVQIAGSFDSELKVIDLETGETVGTSPVPESNGSRSGRPAGIAVSQDGKEIAALFDDFGSGRIVIWDFATGRVVGDHLLTETYDLVDGIATFYRGPKLLWFPDRQRWLIHGHGIVDRVAQKVIYVFPNDQSGYLRMPVTSSQLLAVNGGSLSTLDLPTEAFQKAVETIQSGGLAMDAKLPKLTIADRKAVELVNLSPVENTKIGADPAPEPHRSLMTRKKTVKLPRGEGSFAQLFVSDGAAARLLVTHKTKDDRFFRRGQPLSFQIWLEVFDLKTGAQQKSIEIPYPSDAIAFSASGKFTALRIADRQDRIDIWDVDAKEYRVGFRPFYEAGRKTDWQDEITNDYHERVIGIDQVAAAQFIDDDHLITINAKGTLAVWKLPECRALFQFDYTGTPGISPGRNFLVAKSGEHLHLIESRTGKIAASLQADGEMEAAAFHNGGKLLAIVLRQGADHFLSYWNLETGDQLGHFPLPQHGNSLRFCNETQVLLNDSLLIDLERHAVAWTYERPNYTYFSNSPDDRIWYFGPEDLQRGELYLNAVQIPEPAIAERIAKSPLTAEYIPLKGKKIKLETAVNEVPEKEQFEAQLRGDYTRKLQELGALESSLADIDLRLGVSTKQLESVTQEFVRYRSNSPFGAPMGPLMFSSDVEILEQGSVTYERKQAFCSWELKYQGYPVWKDLRTVDSGTGSLAGADASQSASAIAAKASSSHIERFWINVRNQFASPELPTFIFAPGSEKGLGTSYFTKDGISARPQ